MRTLSMRIGHQPATALAWQDTADIYVVPLDEFGVACVEHARFLDAALWVNDKRLRVIYPGIAETGEDLPLLAAHSTDEALAREHHRRFLNAKASPEGDLDHCILLGSLMEPKSAEWCVTFLRELFADPRLLHLWRCCGLWACSETTTTVSFEQYHSCMARAKKALKVIEELQATAFGKPWRGETPQVIVGRTGSAISPLLPLEDSILVVALGLLCRIYEIRGRLDHTAMTGEALPRPFFADPLADREGIISPPFAHLGASMIAAHPSLLARAAAATLAQRWFGFLAEQSAPEPDLGPRLDVHRRELEPVFKHWADAAMAESGKLAVNAGMATKDGGLSVPWLTSVLNRAELLEQWNEHVKESFGWPRLSTLPLEAWDQSLQELDSLTSLFFNGQMGGFLKVFEKSWPKIFQDGVVRVLDDVAASEMLVEGGLMRPHLMVRSVLHHVTEYVETARREDEHQRRDEQDRAPMTEQDLDKCPAMVQDLLLDLKRALRSIPSPWAFWARIPVIFALTLTLTQWVNLAMYAHVTPETELLINSGLGLACGITLSSYLLIRMRSLKNMLREKYEIWLTLMGEYQQQRFQNAARRARSLIWDAASSWCEWVSAPIPADQRKSLGEFAKSRAAWPPHMKDAMDAITPDDSIHAFIHDYATRLSAAADHCGRLAAVAFRTFGIVRRKLLLPPFNDTEEGLLRFQSWLVNKGLIPSESDGHGAWCAYLSDLMHREAATLGDQTLLFHAKVPRDGANDDPPEWTANVVAPLTLPDEDEFARSDDFVPASFAPLVTRLRSDKAITTALETLIEEWCYECPEAGSQLKSDVRRRLELCDPCSPPGTQVQRCAVVPTEHRLIETIAGDRDRVFTVSSLQFFAFLSVAHGVSLAEAQNNFAITAAPKVKRTKKKEASHD
jgi:hypothetical protein